MTHTDYFGFLTRHELYEVLMTWMSHLHVTWRVRLAKRLVWVTSAQSPQCHELCRIITTGMSNLHITNSISMSRTLSSTHKVYESFIYHVAFHIGKALGMSAIWRVMTNSVTNSTNTSRTLSKCHELYQVITKCTIHLHITWHADRVRGMLPQVITTIHPFKYGSHRPPLQCDAPAICKWLMSWVFNRVRDMLIVIPTVLAIWHATWYVNDSYIFSSIRYSSWYVDRVRDMLTEFVMLRCLQMWLIDRFGSMTLHVICK